jgi:hypothetical protein
LNRAGTFGFLATLKKHERKKKGTTIVIERRVFEKLDAASKHRGASMNLLINSALAHKFGYPPKEKVRP